MPSFFPESTNSAPCIKQETISLDDCLACSGCITSDEAALFKPDVSFLEDRDTPMAFIISPQSKKNLFLNYIRLQDNESLNYKNIMWDKELEYRYALFENNLVQFIKSNFNTLLVTDSSYFDKGEQQGISSECPAVVLYVERVFPALLPLLSRVKTHQQMASEYIIERLSEQNISKNDYRIISIVQCYDKKDETRRDNCKIDHLIGTRDFAEFLTRKNWWESSSLNQASEQPYVLKVWERTHNYQIEETTGMEACMRMLKEESKVAAENGKYIELKMCQGGCINGPAQLKDVISNATGTNESIKYSDFKLQYSDTISTTTAEREFKRPKKKTFTIQW
ncbi:hypothetical protein ENBRE01_1966 [Enteropsectra breve]|nr:hypothetical protein ENBRE01_1966 [Enteropsectra breve]